MVGVTAGEEERDAIGVFEESLEHAEDLFPDALKRVDLRERGFKASFHK